jgi:hypothetical protein
LAGRGLTYRERTAGLGGAWDNGGQLYVSLYHQLIAHMMAKEEVIMARAVGLTERRLLTHLRRV